MRQTNKGFTLIEMIMAMVIASVITGMLALIINQAINSWSFSRKQQVVSAEAKAVLKRMIRDIRRTKDNNASLVTFTATEYEFVDVDDNTIEYLKNGTDLKRNAITLLSNLESASGLEFVYLNQYGSVEATKTNVRAVRVKLIVENGTNRLRFQATAGLRNYE